MSLHAACSPSSATMWLNCAASVTKTKDMVRPSSKYAREGTAAHKVAELTLKGDIFLPDKVTVEGYEYIVSPGMCRALNSYITHIESLRALPDAVVVLEKRLVVPQTGGMVWGTLDCGVQATGELHVVDLKFGKWGVVDPDAPQLKLYALALADHVKATRPDTRVTLTICQPRAGDTALRSHVSTLGALKTWRATYVRPAILRIKAGDLTEHAGPHCRWCVRQTECKAFAQKHQARATDVFDDAGPFA
jgi:hypothetical protein